MNTALGGFVPARASIFGAANEPYVPADFRKKLKELGGVTDDGVSPRVKLVWGGSETQFAYGRMRIKYLKSNKRVPVAWEVMDEGKRIRLPLSAAHDPADLRVGRVIKDTIDVGMPFFFLEEWMPPEVACDGWELSRWARNPDTNENEDVLGPAPKDGLYTYLFCLKTDEGRFMPPNDDTIAWVKKMLWLRDNDPAFASWDWRERPPARVMEGVLRNRYYEMYEAEANEEQDLVERYENLLMPHKDRPGLIY